MKKLVHVTSLIFLTLFILFVMPFSIEASGYGWGFKKNSDHQVPDIGAYQQMLEKYGAYYADLSGEKVVYFTFDNGYEQGYTDEILDVLKKENVPAAFFVTGHFVKSEPELVKRMVDEGHIIGNHSYHHPDFTIITKEAMRKELEDLEEAVAEVSDQKDIKFLRPPRGMFNERTLQWANELGLVHIFWSLAFIDWEVKKQRGWYFAYEQIMDNIHPGAIILLHAVSEDNTLALEKVIHELKKQDYTFGSLDDLLLKNLVPSQIWGK